MDLDGFRQALNDSAPALKQWGLYVQEAVRKLASERSVVPQIVGYRVKDVDSAVGKLSRKSYDNPLIDMTDLVGVRVVCLLSPDVESISEGVQAYDEWLAQVARDYVEEAEKAPEQFGYQSKHFEIRAKSDMQLNELVIPAGTCCELQIRTLMQHTFAEVVHDNIYKSAWGAPSKARRYVSSSAALIETADHLFCETMNLLDVENRERGELLQQLTAVYDDKIHVMGGKDQKFNRIVLDELQEWITPDMPEQVAQLLDNKQFISTRVRDRVGNDPFWSQPVSLLAYWLVSEMPDVARGHWPFAESDEALNLVFSDLGARYHQD